MTTLLELFASFVPKIIVERLSEDAAPPTSAASRFFPAAVFFADVAGFTKLTERIGREGPVGVEKLTDLLNDYFGRVIDLVDSHGGDVIKFAGDAIIAIWKAEPISDGLRQATLRAANCGLSIQETLRDYEAVGTRLSQRISISCGDVRSLEIGGVFDRWEWLIAGKPVEQMADVNQRAAVGRVSLSADAWSSIGQDCTGDVFADGQAILKDIRLPIVPHKDAVPPLFPAMDRGLRAFIPGAILARMAAGHSDWLGELRQVSILFVNLPTLNHNTPLEVIQSAMQTLQAATYNHEGSINKLSVDDKGTTLVSAFGLPPLTHEDDPARAVQTALNMLSGLGELGVDASIGVATGRVFCGPVGNMKRREYTVMGDRVNLTARLMQAAHGDILCDHATFQRASGHCEFSALPPIRVKGKEHALDVFRPLRVSRQRSMAASPMVGRDDDMRVVRDAIELLQKDSKSGVMTVCGEADIGKSRLLEEIASIARTADLQVFSGGGGALEGTSSYYAWRSVLSQAMQFERIPNEPESHRNAVLDHLAGDSNLLSRVALLNSVLPLNFPESETVRQMEGKVRAANTQELLVNLLERATAERQTILLLDDAQWFDSGSWAVTGLVARRVPNLLLVIAMRPLDEPTPVEYQQLSGRPDLHQLHLGPLGDEEINRLLCEDMGVQDLPAVVSSFINERVEGQPFFAQQLVYSLRETNLIRCERGHCELNCEPAELERLDSPNVLTGVITSRLDRLLPQQQMTAKAASVIGRAFPFQLLQEIYPFDGDKLGLLDYLSALERNQIVHLAESSSSRTYQFTYGMIQQVAYNLMLFGQRRTLHKAIAEYYESLPGGMPEANFPMLAHHWDKADVESKSLQYAERAAENALRIGSYTEAAVFLKNMISRLKTDNSKSSRLRNAKLERMLGQAHLGMGALVASRDHFYCALELLGKRAPRGGLRKVVSIGVQTVLQLGHRLRRRNPEKQIDDPTSLEQAFNYEHLAEVHYFANDTLGFLHAVLNSLNVAEKLGARAELARAYANMGVTVGTIPLRSAAEAYLRRASETAKSVDHLPTQVWVYLATGVYCNGIGNWSRSRESIDKSLDFACRLGDERQTGVLLTLRGATYFYQADFEQAVDIWSDVLALGRRRNDELQEAWGYGGLAMSYLRLGRLQSAIENAESATQLFRSNADRISEIATRGVLAVAHLRDGEQSRAHETAEYVLEQIEELRRPNSYYLFEAYSAVSEVFLHEWGDLDREERSRAEEISRNMRVALKMMASYARVFPIGQPRCLIWQGKSRLLSAQPGKACKFWHKSLAMSQQLGMRYDLAMGHFELGRCSDYNTETRVAHLSKAVSIFTSCHAEFDREIAQSALNKC